MPFEVTTVSENGLTMEAALQIAKEKMGYESCTNPAHGVGKEITYGGVTAPATFAICPIVQFFPQETYLYHSIADFLESSEEFYQRKGWWTSEE